MKSCKFPLDQSMLAIIDLNPYPFADMSFHVCMPQSMRIIFAHILLKHEEHLLWLIVVDALIQSSL